MKIVIPNAHWNNRGDEAAHRALWGELRKLYPEASVKVLIKDRKSVEHFPDIPGYRHGSE
jgi:polysaccharide pyruvyl transferase WcaK-like protein